MLTKAACSRVCWLIYLDPRFQYVFHLDSFPNVEVWADEGSFQKCRRLLQSVGCEWGWSAPARRIPAVHEEGLQRRTARISGWLQWRTLSKYKTSAWIFLEFSAESKLLVYLKSQKSWYTMKSHEMSFNGMECHSISWNVVKCHETMKHSDLHCCNLDSHFLFQWTSNDATRVPPDANPQNHPESTKACLQKWSRLLRVLRDFSWHQQNTTFFDLFRRFRTTYIWTVRICSHLQGFY